MEYRYDAWGRPTSKTGPKASSLGTINPFRYRGYVLDEDVGLYYLRSRYYNPWWGRFLSADSILGQTGELLHHNTFAYCNNNPVILKDNNGFFALLATIGFMAVGGIIGSVINMSISILTQAATGENINWKSVGVSAASGFIGGAVAASPLGLGGQFVAGATLGALSYVADSNVNGEIITTEGVVTNALIGGFSGLIGGPGANNGMAMTDATTYVIKSVVRYSGRANQRYAAKAISRSVQYSSNIIMGNTWEAIIRYTAGGVFSSAAVPYTEDVVHLLLN